MNPVSPYAGLRGFMVNSLLTNTDWACPPFLQKQLPHYFGVNVLSDHPTTRFDLTGSHQEGVDHCNHLDILLYLASAAMVALEEYNENI